MNNSGEVKKRFVLQIARASAYSIAIHFLLTTDAESDDNQYYSYRIHVWKLLKPTRCLLDQCAYGHPNTLVSHGLFANWIPWRCEQLLSDQIPA